MNPLWRALARAMRSFRDFNADTIELQERFLRRQRPWQADSPYRQVRRQARRAG